MSTEKKKTSGCALLIAIVAGVFFVGYVSSFFRTTPSPTQTPNVQKAAPQSPRPASDSIEHQLAVIDANGFVPNDDIQIARFRSLLKQLSDTYSEDPQKIADKSVKAMQILKQNGIDEKVINIMEGMNQIFSGRSENQKYSDMLASYLVLRNKGETHEAAIDGIKDILRTLSR